jgi:hypothetical protein
VLPVFPPRTVVVETACVALHGDSRPSSSLPANRCRTSTELYRDKREIRPASCAKKPKEMNHRWISVGEPRCIGYNDLALHKISPSGRSIRHGSGGHETEPDRSRAFRRDHGAESV